MSKVTLEIGNQVWSQKKSIKRDCSGTISVFECEGHLRVVKQIPHSEFVPIELDVMARVAPLHPALMPVEACVCKRGVNLVMELGSHNLRKYLVTQPCDIKTRQRFALELVQAVSTLQANQVVHLDLKLDNIIVFGGSKPQIRLADFGFARYSPITYSKKEWKFTLNYRPPEYISSATKRLPKNYHPNTDSWCLGLCLLEILGDFVDFYVIESETKLRNYWAKFLGSRLKELVRSNLPKGVSGRWEKIILGCLRKESTRWDVKRVLSEVNQIGIDLGQPEYVPKVYSPDRSIYRWSPTMAGYEDPIELTLRAYFRERDQGDEVTVYEYFMPVDLFYVWILRLDTQELGDYSRVIRVCTSLVCKLIGKNDEPCTASEVDLMATIFEGVAFRPMFVHWMKFHGGGNRVTRYRTLCLDPKAYVAAQSVDMPVPEDDLFEDMVVAFE